MTLEYITLVVYLVVLLALGAYFKKFTRDLSDFVRGGAQGSWWLVGMSILMSSISAFTFTGNASAAYEAGPSLLVIYAANCLGLMCGALFLGPWLRQTRAYTSADVVRARYGVPVEQFGACFGVLIGPLGAAIQLYALSFFTSTVMGLPLLPTMVTIAVIVTFYSTSGGKWAVMATDFVQAMVMLSITFLVCYLSLREVGGLSGFFSLFSDPKFATDFQFIKEPGSFPGDRYTLMWAVMVFIMQVNSQLSLSASGRYIAAKDGREASRASWLAFVLMALGSAVWFIPPMVARFVYADEIMASTMENPADSAYAFIAMKLLPNGLVGLLIAAMFAATMSSMDTGLNAQVGVLVRNIIPRFRGAIGKTEPLTTKVEMKICHVATVCLGCLIVTYGFLFATQDKIVLFDASLMIASVIGVPMAFPMFVGLWLKRLPKWSYFPIFTACLAPSIWSFIDSKVYGVSWTIQDRALWIVICGTSASVLCLLLSKLNTQKAREDVHEFFTLMHTPIDYDKEIGRSSVDYEQYFALSKAVFVVGGLILLILVVPNSVFARMSILAVALSVLAVGALLWVGGLRVKKRLVLETAKPEAVGSYEAAKSTAGES